MAGLVTQWRAVLFVVFVGLLIYVILPYVYPDLGLVPVLDPRALNESKLVPRPHRPVPVLNRKLNESFQELRRNRLAGEDAIEQSSNGGAQESSEESFDYVVGEDKFGFYNPRMVGELKLLSQDTASEKGAFCLDGTAPAYYYRPGYGPGAQSWLVFLPGGDVCSSDDECYLRAATARGSSSLLPKRLRLRAILSGDPEENPEFHNWNCVSVVYCDGFSFAGDRYSPTTYNGTKLYFRGRSVLTAVFTELLQTGMAAAQRVILFGHSAGGLGVLLNSHRLRRLLPPNVNFKLVVSAALHPVFSLRESRPSVPEKMVQKWAQVHSTSGTPPDACLKEHPSEEWACLIPLNLVSHQPTDTFYISAVYDKWQLENLLNVKCAPNMCQGFKRDKLSLWSDAMLTSVPRMLKPNDGLFLANCGAHTMWISTKIEGKTVARAFTDWYFGRGDNHTHIDCGRLDCYPNPTCDKDRFQDLILGSQLKKQQKRL